MFKKTREGGFTLIELMIVVAIIGILAAVAIPRFADLVSRAQEAATKGSLSSVRSALTIYYGGTGGQLPDETVGSPLEALTPQHIREIPGGNIPLGNNEAGVTWETGASQTLDWEKQSTEGAANGWAYDEGEMHIWVADGYEDTEGNPHHTW